jgi:hypothetical protein
LILAISLNFVFCDKKAAEEKAENAAKTLQNTAVSKAMKVSFDAFKQYRDKIVGDCITKEELEKAKKERKRLEENINIIFTNKEEAKNGLQELEKVMKSLENLEICN